MRGLDVEGQVEANPGGISLHGRCRRHLAEGDPHLTEGLVESEVGELHDRPVDARHEAGPPPLPDQAPHLEEVEEVGCEGELE